MPANEERLAELLAFVKAEDRVCPQPMEWNQLWQGLPELQRHGGGWLPEPPLILGAWWHTSDQEKAERLEYHIRWASEHGGLGRVDQLLRRVPPDRWHYHREKI